MIDLTQFEVQWHAAFRKILRPNDLQYQSQTNVKSLRRERTPSVPGRRGRPRGRGSPLWGPPGRPPPPGTLPQGRSLRPRLARIHPENCSSYASTCDVFHADGGVSAWLTFTFPSLCKSTINTHSFNLSTGGNQAELGWSKGWESPIKEGRERWRRRERVLAVVRGRRWRWGGALSGDPQGDPLPQDAPSSRDCSASAHGFILHTPLPVMSSMLYVLTWCGC